MLRSPGQGASLGKTPSPPQESVPQRRQQHSDGDNTDEDSKRYPTMPQPSTENGNAAAEAEDPKQKAKQLPCRYCQKRFRRLEHVQRHERTHTKEKPFQCSCGKTFGRRDLLVRHEKLVHLNENNRGNDESHHHVGAQRAHVPMKQAQMSPSNAPAIPNLIDPDLLAQQTASYQLGTMQSRIPDSSMQQRLPCSLDLLSDAATHIASSTHQQQLPSIMPLMNNEHMDHHKRERTESFNSRAQEEAMQRHTPSYHGGPSDGGMGDYNILLDDFGIGQHVFPPIDTEVPVALWARPDAPPHSFGGYPDPLRSANQFEQQSDAHSNRFGGRTSQASEYQDSSNGSGGVGERGGPPWKISSQDHRYIQSKLDDFAGVLPKTFELPSRHTLSRFLEGYVNGFHEHVPFLHVPTVQIPNLAPELILALAAIGAQYRFEGHRGNGLWYASRAVAVEQARRRASSSVMEILSPPNSYQRSESAGLSPPSTARHHSSADLRGSGEGGSMDTFSNTPEVRLETIQALFLLVAVGTWASRTLLRESLTVRSWLSLLVQESGLTNPNTSNPDMSWEDWIKAESEKRTKCLIYCFFNLHCIAYDIPPLIVSTKMDISLPQTAREWRATSAWEWQDIRRQNPPTEIKFLDALTKLFAKPGSILQKSLPATSSLGNYMLITAISQQIFFLRQTSAISVPGISKNALRPDDIEDISNALKSWQASWERTPESSLDPTGPNGPVAFNSTALLRFAFIRLHSDLGPSKYLETRDPVRIAQAFKDYPPVARSTRIGRAVLQAAHALSIPIKIGIAFVARTQTFSWSIQHSLCNLECAFLLSKWLETIALSPLDLTSEERSLLDMVRTMLDETEFAVPFGALQSQAEERHKIRQLGAAVVRLWAETFKGTQIFDIVKAMGSSLEIYADLLEKDSSVG